MEKRKLALIGALLCLVLAMAPLTGFAVTTTQATESIVPTKDCTLSITYSQGEKFFPDVEVKLYRIASVSSDFQYDFVDQLADCGLTINGVQSNGEWDIVRETLETLIVSKGLTPAYRVATDDKGNARFTGVTPGLYMITPVQTDIKGFRYYFGSVLVALPGLNEDGTWNYNASVKPKPDQENPTGEDLQYSVTKVWKDDGNMARRPGQIIVDIYKDNVVVNTVELSEENNWSYAWHAKDDGSKWKVVEKVVPKGYVMSIQGTKTSIVIVNTYPNRPPESPKTGDTSNVILHILLMCASGILFLLIAVKSRKKSS